MSLLRTTVDGAAYVFAQLKWKVVTPYTHILLFYAFHLIAYLFRIVVSLVSNSIVSNSTVMSLVLISKSSMKYCFC